MRKETILKTGLAMDHELERFKTDVDLIAFAASRGYISDRRESSQNCEVMRTTNGDKIVIVKHLDNKGAEHWVYYCGVNPTFVSPGIK